MVSTNALADLPLTVENLLVAPNKWRLDLGVNYLNQEKNSLANPRALLIEIEPGRNIAVPAPAEQQRYISDMLVVSPSLHYGVTAQTEIYSRFSWLTQSIRIDSQTSNQQNLSATKSAVKDVWAGLQHQFIQEGKYPALICFTELALREHDNEYINRIASSGLIGLTTYRINDPIVLSLTASYLYARPRLLHDNTYYTPSNVLSFNAMNAFAVNPDITLNTGVSWRSQAPSRDNEHQAIGIRKTQTDLNIGLAYAISPRTNWNINLKSNVSGGDGATLSFQISQKLGKLPDSRVSELRQKPQPQPSSQITNQRK